MANIEDVVTAFKDDRDDQYFLLFGLARSMNREERKILVSAVWDAVPAEFDDTDSPTWIVFNASSGMYDADDVDPFAEQHENDLDEAYRDAKASFEWLRRKK